MLWNTLPGGDRRAAGSLSDSTAGSGTFSSSSAVRGFMSRLQALALRVDTRQAFVHVRPSWDVRDQAIEAAGDCATVVDINSLKGR